MTNQINKKGMLELNKFMYSRWNVLKIVKIVNTKIIV